MSKGYVVVSRISDISTVGTEIDLSIGGAERSPWRVHTCRVTDSGAIGAGLLLSLSPK